MMTLARALLCTALVLVVDGSSSMFDEEEGSMRGCGPKMRPSRGPPMGAITWGAAAGSWPTQYSAAMKGVMARFVRG